MFRMDAKRRSHLRISPQEIICPFLSSVPRRRGSKSWWWQKDYPVTTGKEKMSNRFSPDQEREICRIYFEDRLSSIKLAEQFQCSFSTIRRLIKRNGFKLRSIGEVTKGKFNGNWKGGRRYDGRRYIWIYKPDHPNADKKGYVFEHRLVMEKHLGRFLKKEEIVHHISGTRNDNRKENLMLFGEFKEHFNWHRLEKKRTKELSLSFGKQ